VVTLSSLRDLHLERGSTNRSAKHDRMRWETVLRHFDPSRDITTIRPSHITTFRAWVSERSNQAATINRHLALLRRAFNLALEERAIDDNPVKGSHLIAEQNERDRVCSPEELAIVLRSTSMEMQIAIVLAYFTGMRRAEIVQLEGQDLDFERQIVRIRKRTKADSGRSIGRVVPLSRKAIEKLTQLGLPRTGPLVSMHRDTLSKWFVELAKLIGIADLRFHDFRHTAATNFVMQGVHPYSLLAIMGWRSPAMVRRYVNLAEKHVSEIAGRLD
jgi:integrase